MRKSIFFWALLAAFGANAAQVHICTDENGRKSYQQTPCKDTAKSEIKVYETEFIGTSMPAMDLAQAADEREANKEVRKLDRDIKASEQRINEYHRSMNSELSALRNKKTYAKNNLAGAQWEDSISGEMNAITARWDSMIRTEQAKLDDLRAQRNRQN